MEFANDIVGFYDGVRKVFRIGTVCYNLGMYRIVNFIIRPELDSTG